MKLYLYKRVKSFKYKIIFLYKNVIIFQHKYCNVK